MNASASSIQNPLHQKITFNYAEGTEETLSVEAAIRRIINTELRKDPSDGVAYRKIASILLAIGERYRAETCVSGSLLLAIDRELVDLSHISAKTVRQAIEDGEDVKKTEFNIKNPIYRYNTSKSFDGNCPDILKERAPRNRQHFVAEFKNGRSLVGNVGYAIFSSDGSYMLDFCGNDGRLVGASDVNYQPKIVRCQGTAAFLASAYSNGHFHWLLDTLPRLALFQAAGYKIQDIDFFITRPLYPYQRDMLERIGIPYHKLIFIDKYPNIIADKLLVTSNTENFTASDGPTDIEIEYWISNYIASSLKPISPPDVDYGKYIYICRDKSQYRKFCNAEDVNNLMEELGFRSVFFEEMSASEKYSCLSKAEIVFAISGAGLTYLPFCRKNTKAVIVYPRNYDLNTFWTIANNCGIIHYHVTCESEKDYYPYTTFKKTRMMQDLLVNIDHLRKTLLMAMNDEPHP